MNMQKIMTHGAIPFGISLIMIAMYFSGVDFLRSIIAPTIPWIHRTSERELGLLENAQNVIILMMIGMAIIGVRRKSMWSEKIALVGIACFACFVLLEEVDYGLHYYEYFSEIQAQDAVQERNLHNVPGRTRFIKKIVDAAFVLTFFILPFALQKNENPYIQYLLPDKYLAITLAGCFLVSAIAHGLSDAGFADGGKFTRNISEFREFMNYYLCTLYLYDLTFKRSWDEVESATHKNVTTET